MTALMLWCLDCAGACHIVDRHIYHLWPLWGADDTHAPRPAPGCPTCGSRGAFCRGVASTASRWHPERSRAALALSDEAEA